MNDVIMKEMWKNSKDSPNVEIKKIKNLENGKDHGNEFKEVACI